MTFLGHSWPLTPFRAMSSNHPGSMSPERLFGPTEIVFFVIRIISRYDSETRSTAAGTPVSTSRGIFLVVIKHHILFDHDISGARHAGEIMENAHKNTMMLAEEEPMYETRAVLINGESYSPRCLRKQRQNARLSRTGPAALRQGTCAEHGKNPSKSNIIGI